MAKVSGSIANFANGVSQQAMALRLATQGELQTNAYSTIVDGLKKRPPTQLRANLGDAVTGNVYTHTINRDAFERYEVLVSPSSIRVFTLDGEERIVTAPAGLGYLAYDSAVYKRPPYRALTVGDFTFITNQTRTIAMDPAVVEQVSPSEAILNVLAGNYGKTYTITINNVKVAEYRTPDGQSAAQSPAVDVSYIARRLATGETVALEEDVNGHANGNWTWKATDMALSANGIIAANGWTVKVFKSTIYVKKDDGAEFSIACDDGYNGNAMKAMRKTVQDFADLPAYCEDDVAIEVTGSVGTEFDNYYVRFDRQDANSSIGVWREIPKPGIMKALKADTMPHVLVREADGTFTFRAADWDLRKCGDDKIAPGPSFVGNTINELLFFKNRLGFLSDENVILSRAGSFYDYWRSTATALLDDDPIDVAATDNGVSVLRSAVAASDRLVLFADQTQFTLMGNELLTPKTASIRPSTSFQASRVARPVRAGNSIFFPVDRGQFTMIRDYRIDVNTGLADATDTTGHVPQYLPGTALKIAGSTHEDILVVQCEDDPTALYVYKYYWSNDQQLQASWSRWTFPGVTAILDIDFIDSQLIMIINRGATAHIEVMEIQPGGVDPNMRFVVNLDQRFRIDASVGRAYDPYSDQTTISMTEDITTDAYVCVTAGDAVKVMEPGLEIKIVSSTPTLVVLQGDLRGVSLYFGTNYEMRYRLSTIFIRQESRSGGVSVITEGRLQLLQLLIQFSKSAYFRVEVTPMARETRAYFSMGRLMGDPNNMVDVVNLNDGAFRVPLLSKNDRVAVEIVNDSYLPACLLSAEWIGNYVQKSQRI
ncbi:hypothetical protein FJ420_01940 [Mesorhizobium sp. B3-1-3]|uniref:phage nozzle protein n=1 Tax=unclassified Mesorhizobium TaxID=325217 RepID=UPI001125EC0D|nr:MULTISPECIES: hypothetical protein [unclassified Mesorhizobium]TPI67596.1 hypothetical protein FJ424_09910 [Mesorhizobium sp. B3-1-8]TPI75642.1 hypothetical protein FJ420_01940 [Mesorhizobium sp. B3-1-3]